MKKKEEEKRKKEEEEKEKSKDGEGEKKDEKKEGVFWICFIFGVGILYMLDGLGWLGELVIFFRCIWVDVLFLYIVGYY